MRGFLHYVTQLARQSELALAVNHCSFCAQNRAADFSPGKTCHQANFALLVRQSVTELDYTEKIVDVFRSDGDRVVLALFYYLARNLAADVTDFSFQISDPCFAGIAANQARNRVISELDVFLVQASLFHLLLDQELLGDLDFFGLGVAVKSQNFHAVLKRRRNRVQDIGGGNEEYLREVVFDIE